MTKITMHYVVSLPHSPVARLKVGDRQQQHQQLHYVAHHYYHRLLYDFFLHCYGNYELIYHYFFLSLIS